MARPRLGDEPYEKLTVRVDKDTMAEIHRYMQVLQAESMGLRVDLGGTARRLLLYGLQHAKALEAQKATAMTPIDGPSPKPPRPRRTARKETGDHAA